MALPMIGIEPCDEDDCVFTNKEGEQITRHLVDCPQSAILIVDMRTVLDGNQLFSVFDAELQEFLVVDTQQVFDGLLGWKQHCHLGQDFIDPELELLVEMTLPPWATR